MIKRIVRLALVITMAFSLCANAETVATVDETAVTETEVRENLALNKVVTATASQKGHEGNYLTDGDEVSYWAIDKVPNSVVIDLEELFYIDTLEYIPHNSRIYGYKIAVSVDNVNFVDVVIEENPEQAAVVSSSFVPVDARYIKLTITSIISDTDWVNIKEVRVYGSERGTDLYCGEEGQGLSINVDGTKITGTFTGVSNAINGRKMTLIVAVFDENRMIAYNAETNTIPEYGTEFTKSISLTIDNASVNMEGKRVEMFIWDDYENMKTLVPPVGITIETAK